MSTLRWPLAAALTFAVLLVLTYAHDLADNGSRRMWVRAGEACLYLPAEQAISLFPCQQ